MWLIRFILGTYLVVTNGLNVSRKKSVLNTTFEVAGYVIGPAYIKFVIRSSSDKNGYCVRDI
jgi:hypothetical protein